VPPAALVYDGDCAFCSRCATVARRLLPPGVLVVAWQGYDLAAAGVTEQRAQHEALWIGPDGAVAGGAPAVARALRAAGGPWALAGAVLAVPPVSWLARGVYRSVAANRYRLPGGTAACRLKDPAAPHPSQARGGPLHRGRR
jgi:predicted DCC family thiol-disulfide oxidoreductase YuxK